MKTLNRDIVIRDYDPNYTLVQENEPFAKQGEKVTILIETKRSFGVISETGNRFLINKDAIDGTDNNTKNLQKQIGSPITSNCANMV